MIYPDTVSGARCNRVVNAANDRDFVARLPGRRKPVWYDKTEAGCSLL